MVRDPFDEIRKIEEMFRRAMENMDGSMKSTGYSVSIEKIGEDTKVDVQGDVSAEELKKLKRRYPDAEISVNESDVFEDEPVKILEEEDEELRDEREFEDELEIEEVDEDEVEPGKLALERFREREREKKDED